jgi:hypothetical protein
MQECAASVIRAGGTCDKVEAPTAAMYLACLDQKRRQLAVRGVGGSAREWCRGFKRLTMRRGATGESTAYKAARNAQ